MPSTTLELYIRHLPDASLVADATMTSAASAVSSQLVTGVPVTLDLSALLELGGDPAAYGRELSLQLFAAPALREAWLKASAYAATGELQLRLRLDHAADELHALRWETLLDPENSQPIALQERVRLVRALDSADLTPIIIPPRPSLRALVAVASPSNLADFRLAEVDVDGEVARARAALGDIPTVLLGDAAGAAGRATLASITAQLREAPTIVILVAHGSLTDDGPVLWLEQEDGAADRVPGADFVAAVARLTNRPLLLMLASCRSAGAGYSDTLSALGPTLARAGVPAVLGFQGEVAMSTVKTMLPTLIGELRRDGLIDRALAAARTTLGEKKPWWQAILWLRTDGRLWREEAPLDPRLATREGNLRALLHDHSGFIASRMEAFVGRETELAEIRQKIAEKLPTGGYVTITGQAGQGKSSVIAKLVADAISDGTDLRERLLEPEPSVPVCHFIPFSPGPDHQVGLLRNLIARLCLSYGLPDFYATSDSRPALRDYFAAALRDLAKQGRQEVIYIDGLDQIEEDASGVRDLSFLPEEPPAGIVFVLGTRPNDTLKPLELRKPQHEYWLPALSRADFDLILNHRGVALTPTLADRFYVAMQENALYLDLVARELGQADTIEPEEIITRIADNPANLFSLSLERLQRNERQWDIVLRPILGLLLVTRAPLSQRALRTLIGTDELRTGQGLQRLGGLIQLDGEGRYGLFHLKLGEFLRQYIFAADEVEGYHQQFVGWCEGGKGGIDSIWQEQPGNALEQERRAYTRQHYIAHLASARAYDQLWSVVDNGAYGAAKRRHDPSTRSYALDLDISRQAVVETAGDELDAQAQALPRLWKYSLLRCSLTSQADTYPEELFLALVALGRSGEALNLAELLSDPAKKTHLLLVIGTALLERDSDSGIRVLQRAYTTANALLDLRSRAEALSALTTTLANIRCWGEARTIANSITHDKPRADALSALATALAAAQRWDEARATANSITHDKPRADALSALATALAAAQRWDEARATANNITDSQLRAETMSALATALAKTQSWDEARSTANSITDGLLRAEALSSLAVNLTAVHHPFSLLTFTEARASATTLSDPYRRADALRVLAAAMAAAQHPAALNTFAEAHSAADALPGTVRRIEALSTLAAAMATAHHPAAPNAFAEARSAADTLTNPYSHSIALRALTVALTTVQRWEEARAIANSITYYSHQTRALRTLATALAKAQYWDEARATVYDIPNEGYRAQALSDLAITLADARHPAALTTLIEARDIINGAYDDTLKALPHALSTLAKAFASAHRWNDAYITINSMPGFELFDYRTNAVRILISSLAAVQNWGLAHAIINSITNDVHRAEALSAMAAAMTAAGHSDAPRTFAEVRLMADSIGNESDSFILRYLVSDLATIQHWDEAHAVANDITDEERRAEAFSTLAAALANAQRWDEARAIIDSITNDVQQAKALSALAAALANAQRWDEARAIIDSITNDVQQAKALSALAAALAAAEHPANLTTFAEVYSAAYNIHEPDKRTQALSALASSLASAQHWDEAHTVAESITDQNSYAQTICSIVATFASRRPALLYITLLYETWRRAKTRSELLLLFFIDAALLRAYPELGQEFLDSFAWVDAQLSAG